MKVEDGDGNITEIASDTSIIVFGTKPEPDLAHAMHIQQPGQLRDCTEISQVGDVVGQGFLAAWSIQ